MADIVDSATRSRMMSGIKGKNTKAEIEIRKKLFSKGFRYKLHEKKLPGKPDIVLPKYNAVILFNGCFWHVHDCNLFKYPSTRKSFWKKKLLGNKIKDSENIENLKKLGWRVLIIWECAFRGPGKNRKKEIDKITHIASKWLHTKSKYREVSGKGK
jgi:DNA mismatch endonuclease (patch repair protein)